MNGFRCLLPLACLLLLRTAAGEEKTTLEAQVNSAMDKVYPALLYIQPVTEDYSAGRRKNVVSSGSGVIVSEDGLALTNFHVAGHARYLLCTLSNKEQVEATLVGGDPATDIAVIQLDKKNFRKRIGKDFVPAALGKMQSVRVGKHVLAMGSPFGYDRSVSLGIVSCMDRYLGTGAALPTGEQTGTYNTWIQTDAAINPGNSGGPLVDLQGRVVGINARVVFYGNSIGFAIPIDVVKEVQASILKHGRVPRSWLGISLQNTVELESKMGRKLNGALIAGVVADSPAAKAGIVAGDLLLQIGETPLQVRHQSQLPAVRRLLANMPIGKPVKLTVQSLTGGEARTLALKTSEKGRQDQQHLECPGWGITVRGLTSELARRLRVPTSKGVVVFGVQPGSPAQLAGLEPGTVLTRIDTSPITGIKVFGRLYGASALRKDAAIDLTCYRGKSMEFCLIRPSYDAPAKETP